MLAGIGREVLDSQALDATTLSLRTLFHAEFQAVAVNGCLPRPLHLALHMLDVLLEHSVQEIEGCNNLIKLAGARSPNMSLELLSARIGIKKATQQLYTMTSVIVKSYMPILSGRVS